MNATEHRQVGEDKLTEAARMRFGDVKPDTTLLTEALVHATLALTAPASVEPWPKDVIARHLNQVGAYVDVQELVKEPEKRGDLTYYTGVAYCTGCPQQHIKTLPDPTDSRDRANTWAARHAATCRAVSRPDTSGQ